LIYEKRIKRYSLRGFGGSAGNRSMITDRGGTGRAANRRTTRYKYQRIKRAENIFSDVPVCEATEAGTCGGLSRKTSGGG
jgi:hypothetical protein